MCVSCVCVCSCVRMCLFCTQCVHSCVCVRLCVRVHFIVCARARGCRSHKCTIFCLMTQMHLESMRVEAAVARTQGWQRVQCVPWQHAGAWSSNEACLGLWEGMYWNSGTVHTNAFMVHDLPYVYFQLPIWHKMGKFSAEVRMFTVCTQRPQPLACALPAGWAMHSTRLSHCFQAKAQKLKRTGHWLRSRASRTCTQACCVP